MSKQIGPFGMFPAVSAERTVWLMVRARHANGRLQVLNVFTPTEETPTTHGGGDFYMTLAKATSRNGDVMEAVYNVLSQAAGNPALNWIYGYLGERDRQIYLAAKRKFAEDARAAMMGRWTAGRASR